MFGPRATGKSFLIRQQFPKATPVIDLLESRIFNQLNHNPSDLEAILSTNPKAKTVVIDEVQRIPELLNEVHRLIEKYDYRFLLTGSSARRLKANGVNLLAGRAWEAKLFPLNMKEIPDFNLAQYLQYGGLPTIVKNDEPTENLQAYVKTYLSEEIQAEAFVRKVPAFSRFLQVAALSNGRMLNFSAMASDTGVSVQTIREYYQILEDTFIGFMLPAWQKSILRKPVATAKFYFFDLGVAHELAQIDAIPPQSNLYGNAFEHFIALELRAFLSYQRLQHPLQYWRSRHGHEIDFILGDDIAIEIKSTDTVKDKHLNNLKRLQEENICRDYYLVSQDKLNLKKNNIHIIYWKDFLLKLYAGEII